MSKLDQLIRRYEEFIGLPWQRGLAGSQRVIFVVYDKTEERRLRVRVDEFELATKKAGHSWTLIDLTDAFAEWMAGQEYRESYFQHPEDLTTLLPEFEEHLQQSIHQQLVDADENGVVALVGIGSLFGYLRVSSLVKGVAELVPGRLVVLFPGEYENNTYRLLDARDGWSYLAVPITAHQEI
jgi:hypothetical protein